MAIVGVLTTILAGNHAPLMASLAQSEAAMKGHVASSSANAALARSAFLGVGIAAVAGMGLAVRAAADFQTQMATVNTIARLTPEALADIGSEVRALSVQTGTGLPDLTAGLYDLLSVGVPVAQSMEFLANANTLAIGGISTTNEAVNALTTSINAWSGATGANRLTMEDSLKVTDLWAKGIELGGFKAYDIAGALSNVAAQASNFNTPLEQVVATTALLTTRGFTANTALTSMDAAFTALQRVPPGMEKLQKQTGKTYEQIARTEGIHEAIVQIVDDAQRFNVGLVDVFGRTDALGYVINTTGTNAKAYEDILGSMYSTSGTAAGQAAIASATLERQMAMLGAAVNDLGISLGTGLLPPLTSFVQGVSGAVSGAGQWAAANPELASTILPLTAALAGLAVVGLTLPPILAAIGAGVALALSPITLILAALTAEMLILQSFADKNNAIAAANPGITPSGIAEEKFNTGNQAYQQGAIKRGYSPQNNFGGAPWGTFNTPGFRAGEVGSPYAGPMIPTAAAFGGRSPDERRPIQIHNRTYLDGKVIAENIENRLYNDASAWNSGFSNPGSNPIR